MSLHHYYPSPFSFSRLLLFSLSSYHVYFTSAHLLLPPPALSSVQRAL
jgi:hypothetical protein